MVYPKLLYLVCLNVYVHAPP